MMLRPVVAVTCVVLAAPSWAATPATHCPQLVDRAGDQTPASDPAADLLSVSLGSDRASVTVVLRYAGEQPAPAPGAGHAYYVQLDTGEAGLTALALVSDSGPSYSLYRHQVSQSEGGSSASGDLGLGRIPGRLDDKAHTVTMTLPFSMASDILRPAQRLTISARTAFSVMTPELAGDRLFYSGGSDQSDAPADYRIGRGSCEVRAV
jgi:hypothetical protein